MPRHEQIHAILHATFAEELIESAPSEGRVMLFIGPAHPQTEREVEILVHEFPEDDREAVIFHAMHLGPKFRRYREEHSDG